MATAQSFVYLKKNRIEKVVVVVPTYRANSISVQRVQKTAFIHRLHTGKRIRDTNDQEISVKKTQK